jgi:hypothetical protein
MSWADASKHKAVSYNRLLELEKQLRTEVEDLFALGEQEKPEVPDGLVVSEEIARRETRLKRLAEAKAVLQARAEARTTNEQAEYEAKMTERAEKEQAEYEAKMTERAEKERKTGRRPGGRPPAPPVPGPREADQYNFTDPQSRIMKNPTNAGFEQDYNVQIAVDQQSLLIVGCALSNHPNDRRGR